MRDMLSAGAVADPEAQCPVDHKTREKWLEAAKAKGAIKPPQPAPHVTQSIPVRPEELYRYSLDTGTWQPSFKLSPVPQQAKKPRILRLDNHREISTIPRAIRSDHDKTPNSAEQAAMPANAQADTGHDRDSGNWIYPSQEMFFAAMKRKGHDAEAKDMSSIVPIHNAVNERAWAEIKAWEAGKADHCGRSKLVSFAGDSKALTPRARWKSLVGYQTPFDRHDWVIDRCGKHIDYVIDFYSGKDEGLLGKSLNFYLDVRPKLNSWDGIMMRMQKAVGL